jgi:hypothetical protein
METVKLCHEAVIQINDEPFLISHQFTGGKWRTSCKRKTFNPYPFGNALHFNYRTDCEPPKSMLCRLTDAIHRWYHSS